VSTWGSRTIKLRQYIRGQSGMALSATDQAARGPFADDLPERRSATPSKNRLPFVKRIHARAFDRADMNGGARCLAAKIPIVDFK